MGGFVPRAGLGDGAATAVCHVVRDGVFLSVGRVERGGGEAERHQASRFEPEWITQDVLHHDGPRGEILREYPARVRDRVTSPGAQESHDTRRTGTERIERAG